MTHRITNHNFLLEKKKQSFTCSEENVGYKGLADVSRIHSACVTMQNVSSYDQCLCLPEPLSKYICQYEISQHHKKICKSLKNFNIRENWQKQSLQGLETKQRKRTEGSVYP